jgi:hypothetical protein
MYQFTKSSNTVTVTSLRFPASSSQATVVSTVPSEKNISYELSEDGESVSIKAGNIKLSPCKVKSLVIDGSTPTSAADFVTKINACFNVPKVYRALLTQSGTDAPLVEIRENTLGVNVVWTRQSQGICYGTAEGVFVPNKTFIPNYGILQVASNINNDDVAHKITSDTDKLIVQTTDAAGDIQKDLIPVLYVEAYVYP